MRYFRNPNFISFCFLILIKPGCISGIPALGILDAAEHDSHHAGAIYTHRIVQKRAITSG